MNFISFASVHDIQPINENLKDYLSLPSWCKVYNNIKKTENNFVEIFHLYIKDINFINKNQPELYQLYFKYTEKLRNIKIDFNKFDLHYFGIIYFLYEKDMLENFILLLTMECYYQTLNFDFSIFLANTYIKKVQLQINKLLQVPKNTPQIGQKEQYSIFIYEKYLSFSRKNKILFYNLNQRIIEMFSFLFNKITNNQDHNINNFAAYFLDLVIIDKYPFITIDQFQKIIEEKFYKIVFKTSSQINSNWYLEHPKYQLKTKQYQLETQTYQKIEHDNFQQENESAKSLYPNIKFKELILKECDKLKIKMDKNKFSSYHYNSLQSDAFDKINLRKLNYLHPNKKEYTIQTFVLWEKKDEDQQKISIGKKIPIEQNNINYIIQQCLKFDNLIDKYTPPRNVPLEIIQIKQDYEMNEALYWQQTKKQKNKEDFDIKFCYLFGGVIAILSTYIIIFKRIKK